MSAAEKFGVEALLEDDAPPAALPDAAPDDSEEVPPDTAGEDGLVVDEDDDCAMARLENANNTAAVVVPIALSMDECLLSWGNCIHEPASAVPTRCRS